MAVESIDAPEVAELIELPELNNMSNSDLIVFFANKIPGYAEMGDDEQKAFKEYYESVRLLSLHRYNFEFNNKDENHAALVMSRIFDLSKDHVRIFCGEFTGKISDTPIYVNSLNNALARHVKIDVIFENSPKESSKSFQLLYKASKSNGDIHLLKLTPKYKEALKDLNVIPHHFTLGDDNMIRYEYDTDAFRAYCNFDDKKSAQILNNNFQKMQVNSDPIN